MNSNMGFMTDFYFNMLEQIEVEHDIFEATIQGAFLENMALNESTNTIAINEGFKDVMHKIWEGIVKAWNIFLGFLRKVKDVFLKGKLSKKANELNKRCTDLINKMSKSDIRDDYKSEKDLVGLMDSKIPSKIVTAVVTDFAAGNAGGKKVSPIVEFVLLFNSSILSTITGLFKKTTKEIGYSEFKLFAKIIIAIDKIAMKLIPDMQKIANGKDENVDIDGYEDAIRVLQLIESDSTVDSFSEYGDDYSDLVSDPSKKVSKLDSEEFTKIVSKLLADIVIPSISVLCKEILLKLPTLLNPVMLLPGGSYIVDRVEGKNNVIDEYLSLIDEIDDKSVVLEFDNLMDLVKTLQENVVLVGKNNKKTDEFVSNMDKSIDNINDAFKAIMNNSNTKPEISTLLKAVYDASMLDAFKTCTTGLFRSNLKLTNDLLAYYEKCIVEIEAIV